MGTSASSRTLLTVVATLAAACTSSTDPTPRPPPSASLRVVAVDGALRLTNPYAALVVRL